MRLCDYCALEIQDEAVYCRYCHRQLKPYAGIRGKIRCPYCAEWIEGDAVECEYCEHALTPPAPEPLPAPVAPAAPGRRTWDPRDVLLEESPAPMAGETPATPTARRSRFFGLGSKAETPQPSIEEAPFAPDVESEVPEKRGGLFGLGRSRKAPPPYEPLAPEPAVTAALWGTSYVEQTPLTPSPDLGGRGRKKKPPPPPPSQPEARARRSSSGILLLLGLLALIAVVALVVFRSGLPSLSTWIPAAPAATSTRLPPTAAVLPTAPVEAPVVEGTPGEPGVANCLHWDEITLADTGSTVCAYGEVKRWFAADEIPFVALFSEDRGTFAIIDRTRIHREAQPGTCITATGDVEVMAGTRPFIDANGEPLTCP